jgi:hypothetical protein
MVESMITCTGEEDECGMYLIIHGQRKGKACSTSHLSETLDHTNA